MCGDQDVALFFLVVGLLAAGQCGDRENEKAHRKFGNVFHEKVSFALPALGLSKARNRPRPGVWRESVPQEMVKTTPRLTRGPHRRRLLPSTRREANVERSGPPTSRSYSAPGLLLYLLRPRAMSS